MKGSVKGLAYANIEEVVDSKGETKITYKNVVYLNSKLSGTRQVNLTPKSNNNEVWADGQVVYTDQKNSGYDGTVTTIDLCDDVEKDWYGNEIDSKKQSVEYSRNGEVPKFGLMVFYETTNGDGEYTEVFPYCYTTDRTDFSTKTEEENGMDYEYIEHKIACRPSPELTKLGSKDVHITKFRMIGKYSDTTFPKYTAPA